MIGSVKAISTPTIRTIFQAIPLVKISSRNRRSLARLTRQNAGDGGTCDLDLHIFGNFEINDVGLNTLDGPVNPSRCGHPIALFQQAQHLLRLLPLLASGREDEEVENEEDRRDRQQVQEETD